MSELPGEDTIAAEVSPEDLRGLRILQGGLTTGPLVFLATILSMPVRTPPAAPPAPELLAALAFVTLGAWGAALVLPAARLRALGRRLRETPPRDVIAASSAWINEVRATRIVTLALLEGSALFGVGIVFLHRTAGVAPSERPEQWGALVPLVVLLVASAATWPSARSIASAWRRHVLEGA